MNKKDRIKELEADLEILTNEYNELYKTKNTNSNLCFIVIIVMMIAHNFGWWNNLFAIN